MQDATEDNASGSSEIGGLFYFDSPIKSAVAVPKASCDKA
jgi:hypothetical protein